MFKEIKTREIQDNPFQLIGGDWLLVTSEREGKVNTMTASWGGLGVMWGKDVAYVVLRPQRYTKELLDATGLLSLSVLPEGNKDLYGYLGKASGRQEDKIAKAGLTVAHDGAVPYFEEARLIVLCKPLFAQKYDPACFLEPSLDEKWYPDKDYHTLYVCEIQKVLVKE